MRILVIGCGSIGRRHIRLLEEMGVDVEAADPDPAALDRTGLPDNRLHLLVLGEKTHTFPAVDGQIIASPPSMHHGFVGERATLIEKPLHCDWRKAETIVAQHRVANIPLLIGYNWRFSSGLCKMKEALKNGVIGKLLYASIICSDYLPDWRPGFDYRLGYATKKEQGGGVLLDISHELDYACWLFGEPESVMCMKQTSGSLELETEDIADILIRFQNGVQANIHLDYVSRVSARECVVFGDQAVATWRVSEDHEPDDEYRAELRNFIAVIEGKEEPVCTGEDGLRALRLALAAHESADTGRVVQF